MLEHAARIALVTGLLLLPLGSTSARPATPAKPKSASIRIAAYNLDNAFDVFDDPYTEDEGTRIKPRKEIAAIGKALRRLDADVIGVEEIENRGMARAIVQDYLGAMGYRYIAIDPGNDGRGMKVGVISRLPIISVTSYRWQTFTSPRDPHGRTYRFARDLMHVKLRAPGGRVLHVLVAHLKSKLSSPGDPRSVKWRTAEARRARRLIAELQRRSPHALIAMVGDFNTDPGDPAYRILFGAPPGADPVLRDTQKTLGDKARRITHPGRRYPPAVFDYIAASPALARLQKPGSAVVLKDKALTAGSDHRPIAVSFDIGKAR